MTAPDPLATAKRLLGSDPASAARLAAQAHDRAPSAETALLLAAARRRTGDCAGALALIAPLAARMPRAWGVQFEHAMALAMTGDSDAALAVLERAVTLNPGATLARHALGDLRLIAARDHPQPVSVALDDPALRGAVAALLDGDSAARALLGDRFGLSLDDPAAACLVADIGVRLGRYDAAAAILHAASTKAPDYLPARFRLAEALHRAERDAEALPLVEALLAARPGLIVAMALRGAILLRIGREEDAAACLRTVAERAPGNARSWLVYGHAMRAIGDRDATLAAYRAAIRIEPGFAEAYWSIADLKAASFDPAEIAAMRALIDAPALPAAARSHLGFALGKACEDAGDYAAAFAHYRRANADRRAIEPFDADAHAGFVDRLIALFDADFFAARAGSGDPSDAPIFVLGMPRSGSSLIEQILASHSRVEGASELPFVTAIARGIAPYPDALARLTATDLAAFGARYLAQARERARTGLPHFVDKFPGNAFHAGLIHLILPHARIIDVRRDARDCCVSLFAQSFAAGQRYSYDLSDLGRHYAGYTRLMQHLGAVLPGRILRVDYERVVDDVAGETRRLLDHCGLAFEPGCLRFFENSRAVRTASSEQVRQPIYRDSVGRWRRFEPWLGPLLNVLGDQTGA